MPSSSLSLTFNHSCRFQYKKYKCKCQRYAEVKIANTSSNPLKLFYACKDNNCEFLDWAHPIDCGCCEPQPSQALDVDVVRDVVATSADPFEERLLTVENDLKIIGDVGQIKTNVKLSRFMYATTMIMVFVVFFYVLVK